MCCFFFFFNDTATTEIYTLSLHDALPICRAHACAARSPRASYRSSGRSGRGSRRRWRTRRSEEHTSELQSPCNLVCRLLLEKKKKETPDADICNTQFRMHDVTYLELLDLD